MKKNLLLAAILVMTIGFWTGSKACTNFVISHDGKMLYYLRNYDRDMRNAIIMVNQRGVYKTAMVSGRGHRWVSKYGSITNNQYGRDNPVGGMNEKGLVIEPMVLNETKSYVGSNTLPGINPGQWVQYQLDVSGSVADVIKNAKKVRLMDLWVPLHYLICDSVSCAVIEYLGDSVVVHTGEDLGIFLNNEFIPVRASSNSPYSVALDSLSRYAGYGSLPEDTLTCSMDPIFIEYHNASAETGFTIPRFIKAAHQIKKVESSMDPLTFNMDSAFSAMDIIVQDGSWSRFQLVYDIQNKAVSWRSIYYADSTGVHASPARTPVFLKDFNFDKDQPVQITNMQDPADPILNADKEKPIQDLTYTHFINYTQAYNKEIVLQADKKEIMLKDHADGFMKPIVGAMYDTETTDWWVGNFMQPLWYGYPEVYTSILGYVSDTMLLDQYIRLLRDPLSKTLTKMISDAGLSSDLTAQAKGSFKINSYFSAGYSAKFDVFPKIQLNDLFIFNGSSYKEIDFNKLKDFFTKANSPAPLDSTSSYIYLQGKSKSDFKASMKLYYSYQDYVLGHFNSKWEWVSGHWVTVKVPFSASVRFKGISLMAVSPFSSSGDLMNTCLKWARPIIIPDYEDIEINISGLNIAESNIFATPFTQQIQQALHMIFFSAPLTDGLTVAVNLALMAITPFCLGGF